MSILSEPDSDQLLDARYEASFEPEDFLDEHSHPLDCQCERCTEDRELF